MRKTILALAAAAMACSVDIKVSVKDNPISDSSPAYKARSVVEAITNQERNPAISYFRKDTDPNGMDFYDVIFNFEGKRYEVAIEKWNENASRECWYTREEDCLDKILIFIPEGSTRRTYIDKGIDGNLEGFEKADSLNYQKTNSEYRVVLSDLERFLFKRN